MTHHFLRTFDIQLMSENLMKKGWKTIILECILVNTRRINVEGWKQDKAQWGVRWETHHNALSMHTRPNAWVFRGWPRLCRPLNSIIRVFYIPLKKLMKEIIDVFILIMFFEWITSYLLLWESLIKINENAYFRFNRFKNTFRS